MEAKEYELIQDDIQVAATSGENARQEIEHYATMYGQDGPVEIYEVVRTKIYPVPVAAPSAASAAPADSHNFEVCQHFNNWLIRQGLLLTNHTEESDGPMAPAMNWIASVQAAIAASRPKCELTDSQIHDMVFGYAPSCKIGEGRELARAIAAASGSNAALVEALKMAIRQNECDMLMTGDELRKARAALAAAGVEE